MRNYLFTRGMQWNADYFDDTHVLQGNVPLYAIGRNDVDLKGQIDYQNNLFLSGLPPNWTIEPHFPNDPITMYFVLDKASLMVTIQAFAANFVSDVIANQPPFFPIVANPKVTPRKTGWTDPAGVKREPTPSDKGIKFDFAGAQALLDNFLALCDRLIAQLTADKSLPRLFRLREINIVRQVKQQVLDGILSITDALQELIDAAILR